MVNALSTRSKCSEVDNSILREWDQVAMRITHCLPYEALSLNEALLQIFHKKIIAQENTKSLNDSLGETIMGKHLSKS